jgi:AcrR family transcriptional regulator
MARANLQRRDVLDVASRILSEEGIAALTMRRIAQEVGASTMVLYTQFGEKDRLVDALLVESFVRFAAALRAVPTPPDDSWGHLAGLGRAYRRFALDNPTYYRLMWSPLGQRDCDSPERAEAQRHGKLAYAILVEATTRVMATMDRPARDIEPAAIQVWSTIHGFVLLEMSHELTEEQATALFDDTLQFIARGLGKR